MVQRLSGLSEPEDIQYITNSIEMFHYCCNDEPIDEVTFEKIRRELCLIGNPPYCFLELSRKLSLEEPQYYFNKTVMNEVFQNLEVLLESSGSSLVDRFLSAQKYLFIAIKAYEGILSMYKDLNEVSYSEELKARMFRNPIYVQTCEDCLMNFYRFCLEVFSTEEKDYTLQKTLGQALPALKKLGFIQSINIDLDIRNSINHGSSSLLDETYIFKYYEVGKVKSKELKNYEYAEQIDQLIDISGGWLAGFIQFLAKHPEIISVLSSDTNENNRSEWLKLIYKSHNTDILFVGENKVKSEQLDIAVKSSIVDKNKLLMVFAEIAKGAREFFPAYQKYFIKYSHNRSPGGFIFFEGADLDVVNVSSVSLLEQALNKEACLVWDIEQGEVDERAFNYHVFQHIKGQGWHLSKIIDCSSSQKRIKANLILEKKFKKGELENIIKYAIAKLKVLYTPKNPKIDVAHGETEASAVFLNVFQKSNNRNSFCLFPSNSNFICLAHYYENSGVTRLRCGGVPESLWNGYEHEVSDNINLAWNPEYEF